MSYTSDLTSLQTAGLISLAQNQPELEYLFRHALVQEAAYHSLLKADRKRLHQQVAESLETAYPQRIDELAAVLGFHFAKGESPLRALPYYCRAGKNALQVYALPEALDLYTQALDLARASLPTSQPFLREIFLHRGRVLEFLIRVPEALANYEEMLEHARTHNDAPLELDALMRITTIQATPTAVFNPEQGRARLEEALALAHRLKDRAAGARILWSLLLLNVYTGGDAAQMLDYGQRALAIARELNLRELMALTLNDLWYAYAALGAWDNVERDMAEARLLWQELGNAPMLAENLAHTSHYYLYRAHYAQSVAYSEAAYQVGVKSQNIEAQLNSWFMVALAHVDLGEITQALTIMEQAVALGEQHQVIWPLIGTRSDLAWLYGQLGQVEVGLSSAQTATTLAETKFPLLLPWARANLMRLWVKHGDVKKALAIAHYLEPYLHVKRRLSFMLTAWAQVGLAQTELALATGQPETALTLNLAGALRSHRLGLFLPEALYLKGQALLALNRSTEAWACWQDCLQVAQEFNVRKVLWKVNYQLGQLAITRGQAELTPGFYDQGRLALAYILDHCPPLWRASFIRTSEVAEVLQPFGLPA